MKISNNIPPYIQLEEFSATGQDAITSLLLENIIPSEKMLEHLKLLDSGKITPEEFRELGRARG